MMTEPTAAPDLTALWRDVVAAIPSRRITGNLATQLVGFRRHLALDAHQRVASGGWVRYLEVGVRMGHSLAIVALAAAQRLEVAVGIDLWVPGYAGEVNAGPSQVYKNLSRLGVDTDQVDLLSGDSHDLLPQMIGADEMFNVVLIDGDHTAVGARRDLEDGFELLEVGGLLVFDDAVHRGDDDLLRVWREFTRDHHGITSMFVELDDDPAWCWLMRGSTP